MEVAALLTSGLGQRVRGGGELCGKAICSQQRVLGNTQSMAGKEGKGAGRNWKPRRQLGRQQVSQTKVGRVRLCSWTAAGHRLCWFRASQRMLKGTAGGRWLAGLGWGEEAGRACRQQITQGEHTLEEQRCGQQKKQWENTAEAWGSLCECGLGRAESFAPGEQGEPKPLWSLKLPWSCP